MIIRSAFYPDAMFRRRFPIAPTREQVLAAFLLGIVIGGALLGVGWFAYQFLHGLVP